MELLTVELARVLRLRPARVPVMAIGNDQGVEDLGLAGIERDLPGAVRAAACVRDFGAEPDVLAQSEAVRIVVEIGLECAAGRDP
jgi:hypothetical protein